MKERKEEREERGRGGKRATCCVQAIAKQEPRSPRQGQQRDPLCRSVREIGQRKSHPKASSGTRFTPHPARALACVARAELLHPAQHSDLR